jgi:hypothetical protein
VQRGATVACTEIFEALWLLFVFDCIAFFCKFGGVHSWIDRTVVRQQALCSCGSIHGVCSALSLACSYYPKTAACLQRSAVAAKMLMRRGVPADVVIAVQQFPFASHAWVEVAGFVVNDKPKVRELFTEIDRFGGQHKEEKNGDTVTAKENKAGLANQDSEWR